MPTCPWSCVAISPPSGGCERGPLCLLVAWNTRLAQSAPWGNDTQLVWLGSGLNRPRLCHQRSRSGRTHVNNAHTRETDWNLPDSFPIKHRMALRQIDGRRSPFVRDGPRCLTRKSWDSSRYSYLQFTCRQMSWLLAVVCRVVFFPPAAYVLEINNPGQLHLLCIL